LSTAAELDAAPASVVGKTGASFALSALVLKQRLIPVNHMRGAACHHAWVCADTQYGIRPIPP
jgi:hypothetical protein